MTVKKETLFNRLVIELLILISRLLNFLDFKLRTLFIFFNILICSFFLMIYVKPILDSRFLVNEVSKQENQNIPSPSLEVIQLPEQEKNLLPTEPSKKLILENLTKDISAKSFIVYDLKTETEIYEKDKTLTLPPASLVKMVSVMYFYEKIKLNEVYTSYSECNLVEGQKVGYKKGEKITGKDLIYSSLVYSGGDSICNMYKITDSNIPDFNIFAKSLEMRNSNFTNFIGLDYPGNYTTSEDLLNMTIKFIKNPVFNEVVSQKSYKMENGKLLYNTNKMLFEDKNAVGIKTGTTFGAKENLIYRHTDKVKDLDIIIIILNSGSRYSDTKNILSSIKRI